MAKQPIGYKFNIQSEILETINKFLQLGVSAPIGAVEYLQLKLENAFKNNIMYSEEEKGASNADTSR